jgi:hypothetical protein
VSEDSGIRTISVPAGTYDDPEDDTSEDDAPEDDAPEVTGANTSYTAETAFPATTPPAGQAHDPRGDPCTGWTAEDGTPRLTRPVTVASTPNEEPAPCVSSSRFGT